MEIVGQRPIDIEQIPDGEMLFQIAFRKGDKIYNTLMVGPAFPIVASAKARGIVVMNLMAKFVADASSVYDIAISSDPTDAPDPAELGKIERPDAHLSFGTDLEPEEKKSLIHRLLN